METPRSAGNALPILLRFEFSNLNKIGSHHTTNFSTVPIESLAVPLQNAIQVKD